MSITDAAKGLGPLAPGPGRVATRADLEANALGRFPVEAGSRPPVYAVRHTGAVSRVQLLHDTGTGVLSAATGNWGRVLPVGSP